MLGSSSVEMEAFNYFNLWMTRVIVATGKSRFWTWPTFFLVPCYLLPWRKWHLSICCFSWHVSCIDAYVCRGLFWRNMRPTRNQNIINSLADKENAINVAVAIIASFAREIQCQLAVPEKWNVPMKLVQILARFNQIQFGFFFKENVHRDWLKY